MGFFIGWKASTCIRDMFLDAEIYYKHLLERKSINDMMPQNYMLQLIDKAINWKFIYDLVKETWCWVLCPTPGLSTGRNTFCFYQIR